MAICEIYYVKIWIPNPGLVHSGGSGGPGGPGGATEAPQKIPVTGLKDYGVPAENFFEGEVEFHFVPNPDGTLSGDAGGTPINSGYHNGNYFKVDFDVGPGSWEITAKVDDDGFVEGTISVSGGGFPNLVYSKKS